MTYDEMKRRVDEIESISYRVKRLQDVRESIAKHFEDGTAISAANVQVMRDLNLDAEIDDTFLNAITELESRAERVEESGIGDIEGSV
ncbi:MAG: hypothetical protein GY771_08925 [bacterium]|nr:hypothetical protein [bacterium]